MAADLSRHCNLYHLGNLETKAVTRRPRLRLMAPEITGETAQIDEKDSDHPSIGPGGMASALGGAPLSPPEANRV